MPRPSWKNIGLELESVSNQRRDKAGLPGEIDTRRT